MFLPCPEIVVGFCRLLRTGLKARSQRLQLSPKLSDQLVFVG